MTTYVLDIKWTHMKLSPVLHFLSAATMKAFLALTFLAALSLAACVDFKNLKPRNIVMPVNPRYRVPMNEQANRITGGSPAERGQFPWQVAVITDNTWFCGGSLISSLWVLTAAHCAGSSYLVVLGANLYDASESGALILASSNSIINSGYNPSNIENDIAVVRLPITVAFTTYISPIRLRNIEGDLAGESVRVSGWGKTNDSTSSLSPTLNFVDLTVITNAQCANTYGSVITPTKLCVATPDGQSTCDGDSGGPLIYLESDEIYTQVGIVSFGAAAGCELGYPIGFTRVTRFLSWISENTGISID